MLPALGALPVGGTLSTNNKSSLQPTYKGLQATIFYFSFVGVETSPLKGLVVLFGLVTRKALLRAVVEPYRGFYVNPERLPPFVFFHP